MATGKKPNTAQIAATLAEPVLRELGLELWDIRFEKEGGNWFLRYFIDKEGGVNIGDCVDMSRQVEKLLDEADPIPQSYTLEVCSPGIDRKLIRDDHFQKYMGHPVSVRLIRPVDGVRDFVGVLQGKDGDTVTILLEHEGGDGDVEMTFSQKEAAFVKLYADFDIGGFEQ